MVSFVLDQRAPRNRESAMWFLSLMLTARAVAPADCEAWGQIDPAEKVVYVGESATFRICNSDEGDVDACSWDLSTDLGTLSASTGSPVDWTAPDSLEDCLSIEFSLIASCQDPSSTGTAAVELRCNDEQLEELRAQRGSTIAGGGCGATSVAGLLALGLGLSSRSSRRRGRSPRRPRWTGRGSDR